MSLELTQVVGYASLQGGPRFGRQKFGVPTGGAFDLAALSRVNQMVGNEPQAAALEIAMGSARLLAHEDAVIALSTQERPIWLHSGEEIEVKGEDAVYVYAAIQGGFVGSPILTTLLKSGQILGRGHSAADLPSSQPLLTPSREIAIQPGPQAASLEGDALYNQEFIVSTHFDRRGIRLMSEPIRGGIEMVSEPCCVGAIQVTPDGQLIIIGPDGPTISGYPKIAVCTRESLGHACQIRPGERLRFTR